MFSSSTTLVGSDAEPVPTALVSEQFFSGLRPRLALGSGFAIDAHAADAEPVVVLSYRFWQQRFAGDRGVLGSFVDPKSIGTGFLKRANCVSTREST
jgi:hypothetical protein